MAMYSTLPLEFLGARSMSLMILLAVIMRIELAKNTAGNRFILAGIAEDLAVEGRRHRRIDDDLCHPGLRRRRPRQERSSDRNADQS